MSDEMHYTVAEANELLPYLAPALVELRETFEEASVVRAKVASAAAGNGWSSSREQWSTLLARVSELIDRLRDWGVQLRDIDRGLVDLPGSIGGERVWLCWRLGEPEVAYWHPVDEGFGSRRPL